MKDVKFEIVESYWVDTDSDIEYVKARVTIWDHYITEFKFERDTSGFTPINEAIMLELIKRSNKLDELKKNLKLLGA